MVPTGQQHQYMVLYEDNQNVTAMSGKGTKFQDNPISESKEY
jgi:hypothetical protein